MVPKYYIPFFPQLQAKFIGFLSLFFDFQNFWAFCTEVQVSFCRFIQFYVLTKKCIEIHPDFVYNVFIVVLGTHL